MKAGTTIVRIMLLVVLLQHSAAAQDKLYPNEFALSEVRLLDGPFSHARDLNIQVLLKYNADRLLAGYRKEAGLPAKAKSYGNWEGLDGHVGGHYLSALAINFAATGNAECKKRLEYMIAELKSCQQANTLQHPDWGKGYVGAVPNSQQIWSTFQKGDFTAFRAAWVPWYNVHKMYAGLRDAWLYAGNEGAKKIFLAFCDWAVNITAALSNEQMQSMLNTEQGGMNEVLADAFQMTADVKYLTAAKRFSHQALLQPMAAETDNLDNKHANTQVPKAVGFARIGELTGESQFIKAGNFFWQTVTDNRTVAFGGNSRREFFPGANSCTDFIDDVEGPETCNSYNLLKLTEDEFRQHPLAKFADYYERTMFNHILSSQNPVNGGYVYFTPVRPRHYRVYSAPEQAMWCCVGSGMENHSKYNQFIYTHQNDSLFVNLFIASTLDWKEKGIQLTQQTVFPYEEKTKLYINKANAAFTLMIRYPSWVAGGAMKISINGKPVNIDNHPSSYIAIKRSWKKGDVLQVELPMHNSIERLPNVTEYVAILHGPIVLAAKTGTEDMKGLVADDSRWGQIAGGKKLPLNEAPVIVDDEIVTIPQKIIPVKDQPLHFTMSSLKMKHINSPLTLEPFFSLHNSRYMLYWMALTGTQYQTYNDSIANIEKEKLALQKLTVDFVAAGEQQPEADHAIEKNNSRTGNNNDAFWRDANNGGYFSYLLSTEGNTGLSLMIRYWGAEWGSRKFDIYIDDEKLIAEDNTGRWNQSKFQNIKYAIPDAMLKDKQQIRVKFQAPAANAASAVYYVRLIKNNK